MLCDEAKQCGGGGGVGGIKTVDVFEVSTHHRCLNEAQHKGHRVCSLLSHRRLYIFSEKQRNGGALAPHLIRLEVGDEAELDPGHGQLQRLHAQLEELEHQLRVMPLHERLFCSLCHDDHSCFEQE